MTRPSAVLAELIAELGGMSAADRRAVLRRFDLAERDMIEDWLGRAVRKEPPSFDALAGLSTWLVESLASARAVQSGLTPATCDALIEAERLLPRERDEVAAKPRSLLDRLMPARGNR